MIDTIYQILTTVLNKELRGNVTPAEFNLIAKQVQEEIFRGYFEDENLDKNKENRGLANSGFANLSFNQRQLTQQFAVSGGIAPSLGASSYSNFILPAELYYIKDRGLSIGGDLVEEIEDSDFLFLNSSKAAPSSTFPVYKRYSDRIRVYPPTTSNLEIEYLRKPADPKWTYTIVSNEELFNNGAGDYQDFELHSSELPRIVVEMLSLFGVNLREVDVARYAEVIKKDIKDEPNTVR